MTNADPREIHKFSELAHRWWDPHSEFKPLHDINPLRARFVSEQVTLAGAELLDVGCGGGLMAEAMADAGARVTGIDLSEKALGVARLHLMESGKNVEYRLIAAETLAIEAPARFDVITCLEMLEHVPDPGQTVAACAALAKHGAHLFFSTINRNPKAYLYAVIGAEYLLKMLPKGTHDYAKFIKPSELSRWCHGAGLDIQSIVGMTYNPITKRYALEGDASVNYLLHAVKR